MALHHAVSGEVVDMRPLGRGLKDAKSAAIIKLPYFEAVRLVVPAGREIPRHQVPGTITVQCLEGRVALGLADAELELSAGDWLYLDGGTPHVVRGIEDASLLLTIFFAGADRPQSMTEDYLCGCIDRWDNEGGFGPLNTSGDDPVG